MTNFWRMVLGTGLSQGDDGTELRGLEIALFFPLDVVAVIAAWLDATESDLRI